MADNFLINALKGVNPADAMPFGAAATPEGSPTALSAMLSGLFGMPKHLVEGAQNATPGLRRQDVTDIPGKGQPNDPLYNTSADMAMALAGAGAPAAEAGAAGIFGGKLAKTADLRALNEAKLMALHGRLPDFVRLDTNWFRSPADHKWRFEIPDNNSRLKYMPTEEGDGAIANVGSLFQHPELFKAYPELQGNPAVLIKDSSKPTGHGLFENGSGTVHVAAPNSNVGRSVMLHELNHGVQNIEGFSPGNNPAYYAHQIEKGLLKNPSIGAGYDFQTIKDQAYNLYRKTSGEVESRLVQKRADYTPEQRKRIAPYWDQDISYRNQVVFDPLTETVKALKQK